MDSRIPSSVTPLRSRGPTASGARVLALRAYVLGSLLAAWLALPRRADAQVAQRFAVHAEGGAGTMLPAYQRDTLGYGVMVQGAARLAFTVIDPLAVQVSGESWFAPATQGGGQQFSLTGGLRFEPRIGRAGRLFVDGNAGLGQSIQLSRLTLDVGVGAELSLGRGFAIGPFARLGALFAAATEHPSDALYWSAGLSGSWRLQPATAAPALPGDRDHDGVVDPGDLCPDVPAGDHPDPARSGCPQGDGDADGCFDRDDRCPDVPAGDRPDPARCGCPVPDADRDGILDPDDACPTLAAGPTPDPERRGCPDNDQDGDRVTDHADACPTVPMGAHPDAARPGCPSPDRDGDAVPDAVDACPDRPGAPSTRRGRNGCPGLVRVERGMIRILRPVFFGNNSDVILRRSDAVLAAVADALRADPTLARVAVEGHTDDVADDTFNQRLSERRATSVLRDLVRRGVAEGRLESHGFGETRPVAPVRTRAARAMNRRVEFRIVSFGGVAESERRER
ncbi:MAG: hypothetical protein EPO40_13215 [Myxococcaceae bacterium]|nr:MAG: hypothetical protein EPO40_13215 [Myxococcaceae bacterium]